MSFIFEGIVVVWLCSNIGMFEHARNVNPHNA